MLGSAYTTKEEFAVGICRVIKQVEDLMMNISVLLQQLKCKLIHPSQECTSH